jgi:threonine dehydrogenase-like Zn-dependent dehydrogenase
MSTMTWNVTQTGTSFNGTVQFAGYQGGTMRVTGDVMDHSATFTLSMPMGSMPMMGSACAATATGTIDMDDMVARMQGTYAGTNTCTGPFDRGQLSMTRRQ